MKSNPTIWLSYVSYPATTAAYFERALRKKYKVLTCGPQLPEETVKAWDLQEMKAPIMKHDISSGFELDVRDALKQVDKRYHPDLFLWVESVFGFLPENIRGNGFPAACYLIDSHINLKYHLRWAKHFDYVFIAQREYLGDFKAAGIDNVFWLPLGCDPEIHFGKSKEKIHDISFVGSVKGDMQTRRVNLLNKINSVAPVYYKRCFLDEMAQVFSESRIVFNNAIRNDLNMRLFEVMSTGTFLLTDIAKNSGQEEMFRTNEDYGIYSDDNIIDQVKYFLAHESEREKIARRGQQIIHNAHTYSLRLEELINVSLGKQKDTPSAAEWRYRSESVHSKSLPVTDNLVDKPKGRSFVIPVLDMSPASPYNIEKLLDDLKDISGDVIVVFNSVLMGEKLKNHPRIDYYAVMKENVGVSRAWNIGLNISQTPVTFIMNSDLSVCRDTVLQMETYLQNLPDAAIVGPQGSFYSFEMMKDIIYFDKGSFKEPFQVDAVSGFLFAVKTELFNSGVLKFDNQYTPCYFEEWDMGLQVKKADLKSYVVPVTKFEHEWSGSIRALRTIKYLNKEETAGEILTRNRELFRNKWNLINSLEGSRDFTVSLWRDLIFKNASRLKQRLNYSEAESLLKSILEIYPDDPETLLELSSILRMRNGHTEANNYYSRFLKLKDSTSLANQQSNNLPDYYDNPRPDIQGLINQNSYRILDVGCGSGSMGRELKRTRQLEVWGVEYNSEAASRAVNNLDYVLPGSIEDNIPFLPDKYFDTIVFADVLEHLTDPESVLTRIHSKLSDSGEMIVSLPNVRFWNVIVNLLQGQWNYEEAGILDKTHLRFFTYSSASQLLQSSGYTIKDCIAVTANNIEVPGKVIEALTSVGYNVSGLKEEGIQFQYLFKCNKKL